MALTAGSRLGPYEILALLGAGGMGEVYRARDTKLHRDVAIKVLPEDVATDPDRLARFEREAQALAALNHPNIASVYAVEDRAIVMELVAGEDLSARIQRAPIPLAEALPLARQIADALAAAHEAGIIHRDLKPANIKVKDDGTAKVLDFGLAKALAPEDASATPDAMNSPTISAHATRRGVILGTAAYMAPEQARGKAVDKRADIWAFGVVLYEMLAGKRLFAADEVSDTLAHVLTKEPDWTALPTATPPRIRELLRHCLTKDVRQRLHDIADARLEIDDAIGRATEPQAAGPLSVRQLRRERLAWTAAVTVLAAALAIAGGLAYHGRGAHPASPAVARFFIGVAPAEELGTSSTNEGRPAQTAMALSPDGRTLVFSAIRGEQRQLFRRDLAQLEAVPMAGTEGADSPFFSPDGNWVGFRAGGALRKVAVNGGPATMICETAAIYGASWGPNDTIVYAGDRGGLWLVP
jgi:tRNA A-37 threonylcarbamoyl transferase component Bud32